MLGGGKKLQVKIQMLEQKEVELIFHPFLDALSPYCTTDRSAYLLSMPVNTTIETELNSSTFTNVFASLSSCGKKGLEETFAEVLAAYQFLGPDAWHCLLVRC